jgi:hypothetical protein
MTADDHLIYAQAKDMVEAMKEFERLSQRERLRPCKSKFLAIVSRRIRKTIVFSLQHGQKIGKTKTVVRFVNPHFSSKLPFSSSWIS